MKTIKDLDKRIDAAFGECQSDVDNFINSLYEARNHIFKAVSNDLSLSEKEIVWYKICGKLRYIFDAEQKFK